MSDKGQNPEYFGIDTEVFQYLLERDSTHPGLWTRVREVQERLAERVKRDVSMTEIADAVTCTRYTQRSPTLGITKISSYDLGFTDNALSRLKLADGVSRKS